jgi:hypothetical protein
LKGEAAYLLSTPPKNSLLPSAPYSLESQKENDPYISPYSYMLSKIGLIWSTDIESHPNPRIPSILATIHVGPFMVTISPNSYYVTSIPPK